REVVRRRGVRRISYFHCDHFEPWHGGGPAIEDYAANVLRFADDSAANEFSRRLTLFYKPQVVIARPGTRGFVAATPGDSLGFRPRTAKQETIYAGGMRGLLDRVAHEVQVHLHHEGYTYNTSHRDPEMIELFGRPEVRRGDSARFELNLGLSLEAIRRETGLGVGRWFFVHGLWALNASDPAVCHITDEIEILMRNGCLGDFTFPAGRPKVDPILEQPHFVRPIDAPHGYILDEAEPETAFGNASAAGRKFFIWASEIRHRGCSLDYYSEHVRRDLGDPVSFAGRILEQSYVADGTLYFKTHAHSMHSNYGRAGEAVVYPHQHPGVRQLMGAVFDAASAAGAAIDFLTAGEVYEEFIQPRPAPDAGFGLQAPPSAPAHAMA
ncbi:MAG: hypothetical protein H0X27_10460, partial [Caulobacteraceae bacterium]|nr:hypothetical protein [Caulobacteraceae bacterium]